MTTPKAVRFAIFVYDDVEPIDLGGTYGTLSLARRVAPQIEILLVAEKPGPVVLTNGLEVRAPYGFNDCPPSDYLIISGGPGWPAQCDKPQVAEFIAARAADNVVASVCTGAMILAGTGLLDGRPATTKRNVAPGETRPIDLLAQRHPGIDVVDALIVDTGAVVTGGGVILAVDATLHLLARAFGPDVADQTAHMLEYTDSWALNRARRRSIHADAAA